MSIPHFLVVCIGLFALLHFLILPRIGLRMQLDRSLAVIRRAGLIAVLQFFRTFFLTAALSALVMLAVLGAARLKGGTTPVEIASSIEQLRGWTKTFESFSTSWGLFVLISLTLILAVLSRKQAKKRFEKIFQRLFDEELQRLKLEQNKGGLEELPPSPEMEQVDARIMQLQELLARLEERQGEEIEDARKRILADFVQHRQLRDHFDLLRRIDLELDPEAVADPPPRTRGEKVRRFFVSQGLVTSLRGGSRAIFLIGLFVVFFSLVGFHSGSVREVLDERILLLEDLQVFATEAESQRHLETVLARSEVDATEDEPWDDEDDQALDVAARSFEDGFQTAGILRSAVQTSRVPIRSMRIRQEILGLVDSEPRSAAQTTRVGRHPTMAEAAELSSLEREAIRLYEETIETRGPRTALGRQVRAELEQTARRSPGFRRSLRSAARAFQVPATTHDVARLMASEILGQTLEGLEIPNEVLRRPIQQLNEVVGPDALFRAHRIDLNKYTAALAEGKPVSEAVRLTFVEDPVRPQWVASRLEGFRSVMKDMPTAEALLEYPPSLASELDSTVDLARSRERLAALGRRTGTGQRQLTSFVGHLAGYEDYFPGQLGSNTRTPHGVQLARLSPQDAQVVVPDGFSQEAKAGVAPELWGQPEVVESTGGGGGGGGGPKTSQRGSRAGRGSVVQPPPTSRSVSTRTRSSFGRSRSFVRLRGFSRVGGVLIGVDPESSEDAGPDVRDLRWRTDGSRITLVLETADGAERRIGPYPKSLVYHALTYAADGRPVTVTMVSAPPLMELKILLHPALLDTPLGCRAIEIDRFVDEYTGDLDFRIEAQEAVHDQASLYNLAWSVRFLLMAQSVAEEELGENLGESIATAISNLRDPKVQYRAERALAKPQALRDPQVSPLAEKKKYYDQGLVSTITACASPDGDLEGFTGCLRQKVEASAVVLRQEASWMVPPPEFQIWSGVREEKFKLSDDLTFLDPGRDDRLWPFDFMLQVAFITEPSFGSDEEADDENPWEFPQLGDAIPRQVWEGLKYDAVDQQIFADMRDFTVLQRLFRLALAERLGDRFPMEKLIALGRETATEGSKLQRTLRWNSRAGALENSLSAQIDQIEQLDGSGGIPPADRLWFGQAITTLQRCRQGIPASRAAAQIPQSQWVASCSFDQLQDEVSRRIEAYEGRGEEKEAAHLYGLRAVAQHAAYVSEARAIRKSMAVELDDRQVFAERTCAPL